MVPRAAAPAGPGQKDPPPLTRTHAPRSLSPVRWSAHARPWLIRMDCSLLAPVSPASSAASSPSTPHLSAAAAPGLHARPIPGLPPQRRTRDPNLDPPLIDIDQEIGPRSDARALSLPLCSVDLSLSTRTLRRLFLPRKHARAAPFSAAHSPAQTPAGAARVSAARGYCSRACWREKRDLEPARNPDTFNLRTDYITQVTAHAASVWEGDGTAK